MRVMLLALVLFAPRGAGDDWKLLHRALHLPHADATCPMSPTRRLGKWPFSYSLPVYLQNVGPAPVPGEIDVSQSIPDRQGWLGQKTPWLVPASYRGPVLIRGARIDAPGSNSFAKGFGDHLGELRYRTGESNGARNRITGLPGRYRFLASSAGFRSGGCYAFQIDGTSFSAVIVMRVKS
jgi:hypothetical protein